MARPSKRNITWNNHKRSRREQLAGFVEALRFVKRSDEEIIATLKEVHVDEEEVKRILQELIEREEKL